MTVYVRIKKTDIVSTPSKYLVAMTGEGGKFLIILIMTKVLELILIGTMLKFEFNSHFVCVSDYSFFVIFSEFYLY